MVVKEIKRGAGKGSSFKNLVYYITRQHTTTPLTAKITNCETQDVHSVIKIVEATQSMARSGKDKNYHMIVSFHADDDISQQNLQKIENELCKSLGYENHQRISVLHLDTNNPHLHIAINKVNPETLRQVTPFYSYNTLAKKAVELENSLNLIHDNHVKNSTSKNIPQYEYHKSDKNIRVNSVFWEEFQNIKHEKIEHKNKALEISKKDRTSEYKDMKGKYDSLRAEIKNSLFLSKKQKFDLYKQLSEARRRENEKIKQKYTNKRKDIFLENRVPQWQEFLSSKQKENFKLHQENSDPDKQDILKKYLDERNELVGKVKNLLPHLLIGKNIGDFILRGTRNIGNNQIVALLEREEKIYLKPINAQQQRYLQTISLGKVIHLNDKGQFKVQNNNQKIIGKVRS